MTVIWFTQANESGTLTVNLPDGGTQVFSSTPELKTELAYHVSEAATDRTNAPWMHRIRLTGLTPETHYNYTVNQGSETFTGLLRTAPTETSSVRFIVYGDSETEPESTGSNVIWTEPGVQSSTRRYVADQTVGYRENLKIIEARNPDFIGIAGDIVESGGEQRDWDEFWRHNAGDINDLASSIPILAAPGNHENYGGPDDFGGYSDDGSVRARDKFKTYWEAPSNGNEAHDDRYYRLDYGPVTYISLDVTIGQPHGTGSDTNWLLGNGPGYPDFNPGSAQYQWLEAQLADAQAKSRFTFVQLHHVPYSTGPHGFPAGTGTGFDNQSGVPVRTLTPLFAQYGVDAVFSGHDEAYQHSVVDGIHFYDIGIGGDGLRGPSSGVDSANPSIITNPFQVFTAHLNAPEVWNGSQLVSGGKHYGHMEINVTFDAATRTWKAQLDPVYVFPLMDLNGTITGWERRIYDDTTILTTDAETAGLTVFSTDFESGIPEEITGPGLIRDSEGYNTDAFLQNTSVPQNASTVLTLTGLPEHTSVSLDFLLAIINSWDGADGGASPDVFNVSIDGRIIFSQAFDNFVLSSQTYLPPDGVLLTPRIGATASFSPNGFANLGLDTGLGQEEFWGDALYAMGNEPTFNLIPHTSSTLTVEWYANGAGYQGGSNESWAIDNLSVTLGGVKLSRPIVEVPASNTDQRPTISWLAVPGASTYEVWIDNLSTKSSAILRASIAETSYVPTMDLGIGRFKVWVRALAGPEIVSEWSSGSNFSVVTPVRLTTLNPLQFTHRPTLSWNGLPGADLYDIWINDLSSGVSQVVRNANIKSTFFTVPTELPIGAYRAWVRGKAKDNSDAAWSPAMSFSISPAPEVTQGQNAAFNQIPVLKWNALPGATQYDIWIDNRSTGESQIVRSVNLTSTTFTVATPMPLGNYRAWVRGIGTGRFASSWTAPIDFRVTGTPVIMRGASSTFDTTPTLAWNAVAGAAVYEVYIRNQSTGAVTLEQKNIATTQFTPSSSLAVGPYRWWVRAETSDGLRSLWSASVDFTIGGRTRLTAPSGNTSNSTPTFTWQQVDGAAHYDLWVDKVGGQSQMIRQETLTGTSFTPSKSLAAGTYRAWIRAVATNGDVSVWSTSLEFSVVAKESLESGRECLSPTVAALPAGILQSVHDSREAIVPDEQRTLPIAGSIESTSEAAVVQDDTAYEAQQSRELFRRNNERVDAVMAEFAVWCFTG